MKKFLQNVVIPALNCGFISFICVTLVALFLMLFALDVSIHFWQLFKVGNGIVLFVIVMSIPLCYLYWKKNGKPFKLDIYY